jgi:hypothetical protein
MGKRNQIIPRSLQNQIHQPNDEKLIRQSDQLDLETINAKDLSVATIQQMEALILETVEELKGSPLIFSQSESLAQAIGVLSIYHTGKPTVSRDDVVNVSQIIAAIGQGQTTTEAISQATQIDPIQVNRIRNRYGLINQTIRLHDQLKGEKIEDLSFKLAMEDTDPLRDNLRLKLLAAIFPEKYRVKQVGTSGINIGQVNNMQIVIGSSALDSTGITQ